MKHNVKYLLAGVFLLTVLLLTACTGPKEPPAGTTGVPTEGDTVTQAPDDVLALVRDGTPAKVVVPFQCSEQLQKSAENIAQMLSTLSGKKVRVTGDSDPYDESAVEILVGLTAYPESKVVAEKVSYGGWGVMTVGNKVTVYSYIDSFYSTASKDLITLLFRQKGQEGDKVIASDYCKLAATNDLMGRVPKLKGKDPSSVYITGSKDNCYGLIFSNVTETDFDQYLQSFLDAGFQKTAANVIQRNRFETFCDGTYVLHAMFLPTQRRLQVSAEKLCDTALPIPESENVYQKGVCETTVTQVGMWFGYEDGDRWDKWINGLCHIIRLEDGSFIIVDGGHWRKSNADLLYRTLKKQAPDPDNIVIAAWIFTHAHSDHVGTFMEFDYPDVKVEQFIANFPTYDEAERMHLGGSVTSVMTKMKSSYPDAKIVNAHPGQQFFIRNSKVEIFWSLDLYYPNEFNFFNESSLIFTVETEGHKIMYLGDLAPISNNILCPLYGNSLKSEMVQTAHHGFEGATYQTYVLIDPKYVFWNTGYTEGTMNSNGNNFFSHNDNIVKWIARESVTVVTLREKTPPKAIVYKDGRTYLS